eukprot:Hpha_TRINITY_DN16129_c0_g3::TRINITY_DN16129_c0_g3_i2::g.8346::m.8346
MAKIKLSWPGLAFLACAGAIGIMMYVFSMSLVKGKNIWPLMVFVAQILIPFPLLLFGKQSDDGTGWKTSDPSVLQHLGFWMTGLFVGFGLLEPIFMYNEGILSREQVQGGGKHTLTQPTTWLLRGVLQGGIYAPGCQAARSASTPVFFRSF